MLRNSLGLAGFSLGVLLLAQGLELTLVSPPRPLQDSQVNPWKLVVFQGFLALGAGLLGSALIKVAQFPRKTSDGKNEFKKTRVFAQAATAAKNEFLANVGHEIRTPMATILDMTNMALEMDLAPQQRECVGLVKTAADSLMELLNELLDLSKMEAGMFTLEERSFSLHQTLEDTIKLLAIKAQGRGLQLLCDIDPEVPNHLLGDPVRLRQIIVNLVGNALKFTQQGAIVVRVQRARPTTLSFLTPSPSEETLLHFQVQDNGIGIPRNKFQVIFERFVQAEDAIASKYGGTGLGLAICSQLVALMGGRIWVDSEVGRGSTFHFLVGFRLAPDAQPSEVFEEEFSEACCAPLSILLVDDSPFHRRVGALKLQKKGHRVHEVANGHEALEAVQRSRFDLVLMDMQMPDMDGGEVTRRLRKMEQGTGQHLPVVALTAGGWEGVEKKYLEASMDGFLAKPFQDEDLDRILRAISQESSSGAIKAGAQEETILSRVNHNLDLLQQLFEIFQSDSAHLKNEIKSALEERNAARLQNSSHTLKGMLDFFQGKEAVAKARALEDLGKEACWTGAEDIFGQLLIEMGRVEMVVAELTGRQP